MPSRIVVGHVLPCRLFLWRPSGGEPSAGVPIAATRWCSAEWLEEVEAGLLGGADGAAAGGLGAVDLP
jgi:hypothetical protein